MSYVRRVGRWEVERSITEGKTFISDQSGKLIIEFDNKDEVGISKWLHENQ